MYENRRLRWLWTVLSVVIGAVVGGVITWLIVRFAPEYGLILFGVVPMMVAFTCTVFASLGGPMRYGPVVGLSCGSLWLYAMGLMVLVGVEINAVLARRVEDQKGVELVQTDNPANNRSE